MARHLVDVLLACVRMCVFRLALRLCASCLQSQALAALRKAPSFLQDDMPLPAGLSFGSSACVFTRCLPTFGAAPLQLPLGAYVCWLSCAPVPADAMARPEPLEVADVPEVRPHDVPVSLLTTFMGSNRVVVPWCHSEAASARLCSLPLEASDDRRLSPEWLGVQIFTPHVRPLYVGVQADRTQGLQAVIDSVADELSDLPIGLYDVLLPLRPQRHEGYLSLLRFPSIVRDPRGLDAVAMD